MIDNEKLQTIIDNQKLLPNIDDSFYKLISIKDELTVLGGALIGREDVKECEKKMFETTNVYRMWGILEENKFEVKEENFYGEYDYGKLWTPIENFINVVKELAENTSDDEFQSIIERVERMYEIREFCKTICTEMANEEEEDFFGKRFELLINSNRFNELSVEQIKKFLTPITMPSTSTADIIINSETSLTKGLTSFLTSKVEKPNKGVDLAFPLITKAINGLQKGQLIATGMFSNTGKTRFMVRNIANLVLKHNKKVLIITNEMTKDDIRYCFISAVLNNHEFKEMFRTTDISINERYIRNGDYKDSKESERIKEIVKTLEERFEDNIHVIHTDIYSDEVLTEIILTYYIAYEVDYFFYDTLKADKTNMSNWDGLKVTATILSELAKTYNICIWCSIQLVDDSRSGTSPLELGYKNIANSKQIYHVLDTLFILSPIDKEDYTKYICWEGEGNLTRDNMKELHKLYDDEDYYVCRVNKNRLGAKPDLLFKVNLGKNTWEELGQVKVM